MPLTLVLGPANSAKAGEVLGAYAAAAHRGSAAGRADRAPTPRTTSASWPPPGPCSARCSRSPGWPRRSPGAPATRARALAAPARALLRARGRRVALRGAARVGRRRPGSRRGRRADRRAERSLVTPAAVRRRRCGPGAREDHRRGPLRRGPRRDLPAYARELERTGRVDAELFAWRALDALRAEPGRWGRRRCSSTASTTCTRSSATRSRRWPGWPALEVTVSLTYEAGRAALAARAEVVEELRPLAERVLELPALDEHYAAGVARRAAPPRAASVRAAPRADRSRAARCGCSRPAASGPRPSSSPPRCSRCCARASPARRSPWCAARSRPRRPLLERVFAHYGIASPATARLPLGAHARSAAGCWRSPAARCARAGAAPRTCSTTCARPGLLERPEVADALEAEIRRAAAAHRRRRRASGSGWTLAELDALAAPPTRRPSSPGRPGGCSPRPTAGARRARPRRGARRAGAGGVLERCGARELGEQPPGRRADRAARGARPCPIGAPGGPGAVLVAEPLAIRARRFRGGVRLRPAGGRVPAPGAPEPFLSDERRRELARAAACGCARARTRWRASATCSTPASRAPPTQVVLSYRSSDEEGNLALRSPFLADVAELLDPGLARAPPPAAARRRRVAGRRGADRARAGARARRPRARRRRRRPIAAARAARSGALAPRPPHARSCPAARSSRYADCPVKWLVERELAAGATRARRPSRWPAAATCTPCWSR